MHRRVVALWRSYTFETEQRGRILTHNWIKFHQSNLYGPYYGPGYMARVLANQANSISSLTDKLNMLSKVVADLRHAACRVQCGLQNRLIGDGSKYPSRLS
ncbi:hypothetical protein Zmor_003413 [Zophobas morio]|uniref:Uncharacterized protein n=1 Tax=Zophobas morio TaxID=2755281 RepID=A0AA38HP83_9CUCU|nr:hypothetical protein Zmor_003413 [Zophobas morio]